MGKTRPIGLFRRVLPHGRRLGGSRANRRSVYFSGADLRSAPAALVFLAPALLALGAFRMLPSAAALLTSFETNTGWGLENYVYLVESPSFQATVLTTLTFAIVINPLQVVLALALATLLSQKLPGTRVWRTLIFLPTAVPLAVASVIWAVAYRPDGPINAVLASLGLEKQPFLTSPDQALPSIIVFLCWAGVGYWMVFLIAGLQEIPRDYHEAAAVDGAGWWRVFFAITLPLLRRPLAFVLIAATVANFVLFAPIQVLTRGGPGGSTNLVMFDIYRQAYSYADLRLASAEVLLLLVVMSVVVIFQFRLLRSDA